MQTMLRKLQYPISDTTLNLVGTVSMLKMIMIAILLTVFQNVASAKIVSYPPIAYVLENNEGVLQCQNRSEDDNVFYNYIDDAMWYRLFPNATIQQYGTSGPVYVQSYSLIFHPFVVPTDQGIYYCCKPGGSCSESSSVSIVVPTGYSEAGSNNGSCTNYTVAMMDDQSCTIPSHYKPLCHAAFIIPSVNPKLMVHGPSEATVGSNVSIRCNVLEGYPLPSVYIITPQGHIDQSTITFNVTLEHAGNYSCIANNSLATVTSNLSLIVYALPKVTIEGPNQADVGANVSIRCNILEGYPPPSVYIITSRGQIDQSAMTFNVTIEDAGNYTCIVNNSAATVTSNLSLIVNAPPKVMIEGPNQADVGSTVAIQCNVLEGYPLPSVYIITPRGQIDQSAMTFNVTTENTGSYSCIANNSLATVTSNLSLIVYAPPKVVIEGPNQTDVRSSVSIRCNVLEGYPPPTVSITTPQEETIEQSLIIILHTTMTDAGNYTCIANNSLATVTSNLSLIVYDVPISDNSDGSLHIIALGVACAVVIMLIIVISIIIVCTCCKRKLWNRGVTDKLPHEYENVDAVRSYNISLSYINQGPAHEPTTGEVRATTTSFDDHESSTTSNVTHTAEISAAPRVSLIANEKGGTGTYGPINAPASDEPNDAEHTEESEDHYAPPMQPRSDESPTVDMSLTTEVSSSSQSVDSVNPNVNDEDSLTSQQQSLNYNTLSPVISVHDVPLVPATNNAKSNAEGTHDVINLPHFDDPSYCS